MMVSDLIEKLEEARFSFTTSDAPVEIVVIWKNGSILYLDGDFTVVHSLIDQRIEIVAGGDE